MSWPRGRQLPCVLRWCCATICVDVESVSGANEVAPAAMWLHEDQGVLKKAKEGMPTPLLEPEEHMTNNNMTYYMLPHLMRLRMCVRQFTMDTDGGTTKNISSSSPCHGFIVLCCQDVGSFFLDL